MRLDKEGFDLLVNFEKIAYKSYKDRAGYSIGIGHYILPHEQYLMRATLNMAQVMMLFNKDSQTYQKELNNLLNKHHIKVNQRQFNALFSCYYNMGMGKFMASGILSALQVMNREKIEEAFMKMDKGMEAIKLRRVAELSYFWS